MYNPNDDIHAENLAHYQKQTERLLAMANAKAAGISEMLEQLEELITPEAPKMEVFWVFQDSRGKLSDLRNTTSKPTANPMGRRGRWREATFI